MAWFDYETFIAPLWLFLAPSWKVSNPDYLWTSWLHNDINLSFISACSLCESCCEALPRIRIFVWCLMF